MLHRALIAIPLLLAGVAEAQTPGFWKVGLAPGTTGGSVQDLTQNGAIAVGATGSGAFTPGFRWTVAGRVDFGLLPGMPVHSPAFGVDSTGQTIVGWSAGAWPDPERAYRRVGEGPLQDLGVLPGQERSYANGVSGNGSIVVGYCERSQFSGLFGEAFRWTESGGMQGLGFARPNSHFSQANAVSRDGTTIVGFSQQGGIGGPIEAFTWREGVGMQILPNLPGSTAIESFAHAVNADGSVVVGSADGTGPQSSNHAVRWVNGIVQDLGTLGQVANSHARATSDDGSIVGCVSGVAFVWTEQTEMVALTDYLAAHGVHVPVEFRLDDVFAVSGDGLTFAGLGRDLVTNVSEGFVATIPSPASVLVLLAPIGFRRRRAPGIAIAIPLLLVGVAGAQTPGFFLTGLPAGGVSGGVSALSQSGAVAAGGSFIPGPPLDRGPGFLWSQGTGRIDFGLQPGMPDRSPAYGVSNTGQVVVGIASLGSGPSPLYFDRAYRWTGAGPVQNLGLLPGEERSFAWGVSGDGSIVVGHAEHSPFTYAYGQAFRWTESGGMEGLGWARPGGSFSRAYGISRDGSTIVGLSQSGGIFGDIEAFRWTAAGGMEVLPNLPGAGAIDTAATAIGANGSVIVGHALSPTPGNQAHAVRWIGGQIEDLAPGSPLPSYAYAVSGDGGLVGGTYQSGASLFGFVWTATTGMTDVGPFLSLHGVTPPPGFLFERVTAISADGLTIAGTVTGGAYRQGFVATIPSPAAALVLVSILLARRRGR